VEEKKIKGAAGELDAIFELFFARYLKVMKLK